LKRSALLAEALIALFIAALVLSPLLVGVRAREQKAVALSKRFDQIRRHDQIKLDVLQGLTKKDLDELRQKGAIMCAGAQLTLKPQAVRTDGKSMSYSVLCHVEGLTSELALRVTTK
jgi:hypothetical protein